MKKGIDEFYKITERILELSENNPDISLLLTELSTDFNEDLKNEEALTKQIEELTVTNQGLSQANSKLFLQVNESMRPDDKPKEPFAGVEPEDVKDEDIAALFEGSVL